MEETKIENELCRKVKQQAWVDVDEKNMTSLKTIMQPILVAMSICGCYNFHNLTDGDGENLGKSKIKHTLSRLYRFSVFVIVILYLIKTIVAFIYLSSDFFLFNGIFTSWILSLLCMLLIKLKASSKKYGNQESAFKFWDKIMAEFKEIGIEYPAKKMKRRGTEIIVIGLVILLLSMGGIGVQVYMGMQHGTVSFYTSPFGANGFTLFVYILFQLVCNTIWMFPICHAIMMSTVLKQAFNILNTHMHETIKKDGCRVPENFQKLRLLHLNLSKLVQDEDGDFGWFYANVFVWNIATACFTLFQVMRTSVDTYTLILFLFWAFSSLSMLGLVAIFAAFVNDAAHAPLDCIYYINVSDITMEKSAQLNLFLSKLTGTQVGFTTCGLLIITKEFILTIAGVFLTYFALLYTL